MKFSKKLILAAILTINCALFTNAQSISDLFKGGSDNIITNALEGIFSSSKIDLADIRGTWVSSGPAVCFQSDNFLKKAGGVAAASAMESKLAPYYEKYGLNNATLTINNDDSFTLNTKMLKLSGTISKKAGAQDGVFEFNFQVLGKIKLGSVTTYISKTSQAMDVMFDASKLKNLISGIAKYTGINLAQTLGSLLDSYEGMCIGFHLSKTGNATGSSSNSGIFSTGSTTTTNGGKTKKTDTGTTTTGTTSTNGGKTKKTETGTTTTGTTSSSSSNSSSTGEMIKQGLEAIGNLLNNKK